MEAVVERENMNAYRRVFSNGAAGVDAMSVDELMPICDTLEAHQGQLLEGCYQPQQCAGEYRNLEAKNA
jgi:hypothetical protein